MNLKSKVQSKTVEALNIFPRKLRRVGLKAPLLFECSEFNGAAKAS